MSDDDRAEKVIAKAKLQNLVKSIMATGSRIASERGELGVKIKKLEETDNLDKVALAFAVRLNRMNDPGKVSRHIRNFQLYCDHLELGGQSDLEDAIESKAESDDDAVQEVIDSATDKGGATEQEVSVKADDFEEGDGPRRTLNDFRKAIGEDGIKPLMVKKALKNFTADHPSLAGEADEIAGQRLAQLEAEKAAAKTRQNAKEEFGLAGPAAGNA